MPATDAIDAAALGKHSYMHSKILTEILNICCLFYCSFNIASYCMHMLQVKIKVRLKVFNLHVG